MSAPYWLGSDNPNTVSPEALKQAHAIADAARDFQWPRLLELLEREPERVNVGRLGGKSGYAPLHQVAHGGATVEVAQALISLGALRNSRTTDGQQPVDIARKLGHTHLLEILTPTPSLSFAPDKLATVEAGVHQVIRERQGVAPLLERAAMRLPPLELLTGFWQVNWRRADEVSGRLKFRRPLQLRVAMPGGHGSGSIFGGGRERWCGCAAEDSKRGHAGPGIPVPCGGS